MSNPGFRIPARTAGIERALAAVPVRATRDAAAAADLFRRKFGQPIPDFPSHYLASFAHRVVGYVHMTNHEDVRLVGGLCVDEGAYRAMPRETLDALREVGGLARLLIEVATADRGLARASFAYTGMRASQVIVEQVGYERVIAPYTYAYWHEQPMEGEARAALVEKIRKLGPF